MSKVGSQRNFGYGRQMAWAGKQALRDQYGDGRYGTVNGHAERWRRFVTWCREARQIRDARSVDTAVVESYGTSLKKSVAEGMSAAYAQNLLSSVNVVLEDHGHEPIRRRVSIRRSCASVRTGYAKTGTSGSRHW